MTMQSLAIWSAATCRRLLATAAILMLTTVMVLLLLTPATPARADYLGKSAAQWQAELTTSKDAQARRSAAFALGKLGREAAAAVPPLMQCAQSEAEEASVRETAVYSLGQIVPRGRNDVVQLLCKLATGKTDERIRRSAVVALGSCGADTAELRATLERALDDSSPAVRQNAVWALGEICQKTDDVPVSSFRKALRDPKGDKLVQRDAALALGKLLAHQTVAGDEEAQQRERQRRAKVCEQSRAALDDLLSCVEHKYVELRKAACGTLISMVNVNDDKAKPVLAKACKDEDIEVRRNAALALAEIGGAGAEAAVPVLRKEIGNEKDPELRQKAVLAFRNLDAVGGAALPDLLKALATDPDAKVRFYTAVTLGEWKADAEKVVPALVQRILDPKEKLEVRVTAGVSLKSLGPGEQAVLAIPSLIKVLDDSKQPPKVRERVLWALTVHQGGLLKYDEAFDAMKKVLTEEALRDPASDGKMLRYFSAYLLSIFKEKRAPEEVFPALLDFLRDPKVLIFQGRKASGGAVGEGGGNKTDVAETGSEDGRIMAVEALKKIGVDEVRHQKAIIEQLRQLRDANPPPDPKVHEAVVKLLMDLHVK